jgi:REP element-mobilizing transposase RayT
VKDTEKRLPKGPQRLKGFDYTDPDASYFVTVCVEGRRPVFQATDAAQAVVDCLNWLRANKDVQVFAYCLMPDHLHVLVRSPMLLGQIVRSLKTFTTRSSHATGFHGKLWQDDYHDHILRRTEDAADIARYILDNPVRAGLVEHAEEYPWSGFLDPM